jgi:hypothetical protein
MYQCSTTTNGMPRHLRVSRLNPVFKTRTLQVSVQYASPISPQSLRIRVCSKAPMLMGLADHAAVTVSSDMALVCGGCTGLFWAAQRDCYVHKIYAHMFCFKPRGWGRSK